VKKDRCRMEGAARETGEQVSVRGAGNGLEHFIHPTRTRGEEWGDFCVPINSRRTPWLPIKVPVKFNLHHWQSAAQNLALPRRRARKFPSSSCKFKLMCTFRLCTVNA
jgi:hypothetical protein